MYRGFNLSLRKNQFELGYFKHLQEIGSKSILLPKKTIKEKINSFVSVHGYLDGSKMQANWFPQVKADVFISHSHKDEKLATALAGWLKTIFGLTTFIDSCVWGYSNDLLRQIDNDFCINNDGQTYSYNKRNYSTSHVHMMLSVALAQMIDNSECLFFLNTPNSITPDSIISHTESPWIYSEITMSQLIRKKNLEEFRNQALMESRTFSDGGALKIQYNLPTEHLVDINVNDLIKWKETWKNIDSHSELPQFSNDLRVHALDKLYEIKKQ